MSPTTPTRFPHSLNFLTVLFTLLFVLESKILRVYAGLFVVDPHAGSTCQAGVPCTVSWVDDGMRPLFSAIGVSTVGLYTGEQQLVQRIAPVDVTKQASLTFMPIAGAGPNSDTYYIAITSTTARGNDSTILYSGWSPNFRITGMSGSFDAPLAAATKDIPIPSSLARPTSTQETTLTITIGASSGSTNLAQPTSSSEGSGNSSASAPSSGTTITSASRSSSSVSASPTASRLTTSIVPSSASLPIPSSSSSPSTSVASSTNSVSGSGSLGTAAASSTQSTSDGGNTTVPSGALGTSSTSLGTLMTLMLGALVLLL